MTHKVNCHLCGGSMDIFSVPKHSGLLVAVVIVLGVLFCISISGIVLGALLLILGLLMAFARKEVWFCHHCRSVIDRMKAVPTGARREDAAPDREPEPVSRGDGD